MIASCVYAFWTWSSSRARCADGVTSPDDAPPRRGAPRRKKLTHLEQPAQFVTAPVPFRSAAWVRQSPRVIFRPLWCPTAPCRVRTCRRFQARASSANSLRYAAKDGKPGSSAIYRSKLAPKDKFIETYDPVRLATLFAASLSGTHPIAECKEPLG